ncbi:MAG: (2Fe-2S)-binding protein [candidate division WOR-3 bacterium]
MRRKRRVGQGRGKERETIVCRCEEVTLEEIERTIEQGYHSLEELKRLLRVGMGHCQGRGCLKIIAGIIQRKTGMPIAEQRFPTSRPPLKPVPLGLLGRSGLTDE